MNSNIQKVTRFQLVCPNCKYEFQYNLGALEKQNRNLTIEIQKITKWLSEFKKQPYKAKIKRQKEKQEKIIQLNQLKLEKIEVKAKMKLVHDELNRENFQILKEIIKEFYGQKEYERCINEMLEREKAYKIQDVMGIGYYSSSNGKHIKKI